MKILVISDSHGLTDEIQQIKELHAADMDLMIHCGDSELSASHPALRDFVVVAGNCDSEKEFPKDIVEKVGDYQIMVTHGHHYSVKTTLMNLTYRAKELEANIVCFGHSHLLGADIIDNVLYINPGSIRLPQGRTEKTYVILELVNSLITVHVYDVEHGEIIELTHEFSLPKRV